MTDKEKKELKEKMLAELEKVKQDIIDLKELTKPISPENSLGRISRMEAINSKSVNEAALRASEQKLKGIEFGLTKIDTDEFGICTRCKQPIPPARLMYMPGSTRCVNCADR